VQTTGIEIIYIPSSAGIISRNMHSLNLTFHIYLDLVMLKCSRGSKCAENVGSLLANMNSHVIGGRHSPREMQLGSSNLHTMVWGFIFLNICGLGVVWCGVNGNINCRHVYDQGRCQAKKTEFVVQEFFDLLVTHRNDSLR